MPKVNPQKYTDTLNEIAQYIYDNVEDLITLDSLAAQFSISKYHLNRLFFAQTGMNIGEFIQRRRMELAYELIRNNNVSVIDASVHVGYESTAAFSRAFKKLFDIDPNRVKHKQSPEFGLANIVKKNVRPSINAQIVELPEQILLGLYGQGFHNQSYVDVAQTLYEQIAIELGLVAGFDFAKHNLVGISIDSPWRKAQAESRFFAGIKADEGLNSRGSGLVSYALPAGLWARFEHHGAYSTLWQTILSIYAHWIHQSEYRLCGCAALLEQCSKHPSR
jgi:AraC family transcriptional regulator